MKTRIELYDLEEIKLYLKSKNYDKFEINYSHYKKLFQFLFPFLNEYYIRRIIQDLVKDGFFKVKKVGGKRFFYNKEKYENGIILNFD